MKKITLITPGTAGFSLVTGTVNFSFSDDLSYFVYETEAGTPRSNQLHLTNAQTGATQIIASAQGNDESFISDSIISPDGQFVAYDDDLVSTDSSGATETSTIYVFDRATGDTRTVFSDSAKAGSGGPFPWEASVVALSPDDQSLFFISNYPDLVSGNAGFGDLFELNLQTLAIQPVLENIFLTTPSPKGAYLVADTGADFYRVNLTTGNTDLILSGSSLDVIDSNVSLSEDGRFAAIVTSATLLPEDTSPGYDVYLKDLSTGELKLVSLGYGSTQSYASISSDDSRIVFETAATSVNPAAPATDVDIVSEDLATGAVGLLWEETADIATHFGFEVSADGETLVLETTDRLTTADTNNVADIYTIHFTPPKLIIDPITGDNIVNVDDGPTITISGTSDEIGKLVTVTLPGGSVPLGTAIVNPDGTWSTNVDASSFPDGAYDVRAFVTDELTTHVDKPITVDRTPPQLTFTSVAGDDIINATELSHATIVGSVLSADPAGPGTVQSTISISIDGGPSQPFLTVGANTSPTADNFSQDFNASGLADGEHTIILTTTDEAGNTTSVTKDVLVDTTPPKIASTSVSGDDVVDSSEINTPQGVHGTSSAIGQTVDVLIDGVEAGQAVVQADGTWLTTISFAGTASGNHDVTAEVTDRAGYVGRADAGVYVDTGFAVTQLSDGPNGEQGGGQGVMFPGLTADGTKLVFTGLNFDLVSTATGSSGAQVYVKDLTTGAITFATPDPSENAEFGGISPDGRYVEFVTDANLDPINQAYAPGLYFTYTKDLTTGAIYFHNSSDDGFDGTNPDTFNPGITPGYYDQLADNIPIESLPVFSLAIADGGSSLELIDDLEPDQVGQPLVMTTQIRLDSQFFDSDDNMTRFSSGGYAGPDASPPIENPFGRFILQEYAPQLSADGSVMAFEARFFPEQWDTSTPGQALVTVGAGTVPEIYVGLSPPTDEEGNDPISALASSFADGTPMPFGAIDPALSADGKFVAFWSWGTDDKPEVFVKNLTTGELKIASSDALGNAGVNNASGTFNAGFNSIAISADGRYVAFNSDAKLTPDDSGTGADLYVKDMQTGAIERVPLPAGTFANDLSTQLTMTANGQYIAFTTSAGLSAMDVNHTTDIYGVSLASLGSPPPQISINAVAGDDRINAAEVSNHVAVKGTSDDIGGTVTLVVDGNAEPSVVVGTNGTWSTTIDATGLIDGVHQLRATVTNTDGATGSDGDLLTVDRTPPTIVLSSDKTRLSAGQTATITATFSEGIGNLGNNFLVASGGTLSNEKFVNDHTYTATFTPRAGGVIFSIHVASHTAFDFAGNSNAAGTGLTIGAAFDGYIVGGTVSYANGSGNGATATTDAQGGFSLSGGTGPLVMTGGTDSSTGLAFTGTFETPDGGSVLSPLTTLIEEFIKANPSASLTQANDAVVSALGLTAGTDLTALDDVAGALAGDAASMAAFKAGSEVLDIVTLIQAAHGSAGDAYAALAADIAAEATAGKTIDLSNITTIEGIAQTAGLSPIAAQAIAAIVSQTDAALEPQLGGASPYQAFVDITGAGIAEQGDASKALSQASGDASYQQVADSYVQDLAATLSQDDLAAAHNVACYCPGTLIVTDRGEVAVEDLRIGDGVIVMSGLLRPIKWIGTRSYGGRFIIGRKDLLPICFKPGSLGEGLPQRDLWISPHHAMYLEGVLIEARDLVNGVSIVQAERVEKVEYFHIELDSHDVILAEGALSETFVDDDSRGMFHNAHEYGALYPDAGRVAARYCAKRCTDGYEVEAARRRIDARAGLRPAGAEATTVLRGYVDTVSASCISGWAQNPAHPEAPVCLDIFVGGRLIGQTLANRFRDDLVQAGIGSGKHSFEFISPRGFTFAASTIEVRRSIDGARLALSSGAEQACAGVHRTAA
jgi:hypothetical protein